MKTHEYNFGEKKAKLYAHNFRGIIMTKIIMIIIIALVLLGQLAC